MKEQNIIADPVEYLVRMVREDAARQLKKSGDTLYVKRVTAALRRRADECGHARDICGGCRVVLAAAAALEQDP